MMYLQNDYIGIFANLLILVITLNQNAIARKKQNKFNVRQCLHNYYKK